MMKMLIPQKSRREPFRGGVAADARAQQGRPSGDDRLEEDVQGLPPDPGLDAEPAAGHQRAHQGGDVRADRPVGGAGEHGEGNPVLRARMRVEQDRDEHDRVAEQDGDEGLPPVHARGHEAGREHVGGDAVRHADPERGVVVGRPVAARDRHRGQVVVVERAPLDARGIDDLDAAVGVLDLGGCAHGTGGFYPFWNG